MIPIKVYSICNTVYQLVWGAFMNSRSKGFIVSLFFLFSLAAPVVQAETRYVRDILKLTVRTGRSTNHRVLSVIESGQKVELIKHTDGWDLVKLNNGKKGWVLSQYLTSRETGRRKLDKLTMEYGKTKAENISILEENNEMKMEILSLKTKLMKSEEAFNMLSETYEHLKKESKAYVDLKIKYNELKKEMTWRKKEAEKNHKRLSLLEKRQIFRWVLTGVGVLLLGFLMGLSTRRKSGSLY